MSTAPERRIIGVQLHHSVALGDASRYATNMLTALESARRRALDDEEITELIEQLKPLVRAIGIARASAEMRLRLHQADPEFRAYVDGDLPWPDEDPNGFVARCRCDDRCLYHDVGRGTEADCNCDVACRRHAA
ncbi:MAG TPA: hypothetical protein VFR97_13035 [Capillimicrobium sp.]|nr:hypothetical protein [Capillimicrobium sp.]